jgi:acetolactate synthase regulatory subunit
MIESVLPKDRFMSKATLRTFIAYVEDLPGVLNRVTSLFRRRNYNIVSLTVGRTERPGVSRMTVVLEADEDAARRIEANLYKLVNVLFVEDTSHAATIRDRRDGPDRRGRHGPKRGGDGHRSHLDEFIAAAPSLTVFPAAPAVAPRREGRLRESHRKGHETWPRSSTTRTVTSRSSARRKLRSSGTARKATPTRST